MTARRENAGARGRTPLLLAVSAVVLAILLALGTWQVQRLQWKEGLLSTIDERIAAEPVPLAEIEERRAAGEDVDYLPVEVEGTFLHEGERHLLSTWEGHSGFNIYTPLLLDDGRILFVNRGFVPYDRKAPQSRAEGQVEGRVEIAGLAREVPATEPSWPVPANEPADNLFYWKDLEAMSATADMPEAGLTLPIVVDADDSPNPGGLPVGGVTLVDLPNNHLQYAVTWYGLAAALCAVLFFRLRRSDRGRHET